MNQEARAAIVAAERNLKAAMLPKLESTTDEENKLHLTKILHNAKNDIDVATSHLNGATSIERTIPHQDTEELSDKLLIAYFVSNDLESARALASGLIAQLTPKQAEEHLEAFKEHYNQYVKGA